MEERENDGHTATQGKDGRFTGSEQYAEEEKSRGIIKEINRPLIIPDVQLGKKLGRHFAEWGVDPESQSERENFRKAIEDIVYNHDAPIKIGTWRGYSGETLFFIKGEDVVITKQDGEFVTILKGGIHNW